MYVVVFVDPYGDMVTWQGCLYLYVSTTGSRHNVFGICMCRLLVATALFERLFVLINRI